MTDFDDATPEGTQSSPSWGGVCVKLLQGPLYRTGVDDVNWKTLTTWLSEINNYFEKIGLIVLVNQGDGYAYLSQLDDFKAREAMNGFEDVDDEDMHKDSEGEKIPRLIKKMPMTVELSMLCVLLREALDRAEGDDSSELVLKESEIKDMIVPYLKTMSDQTKIMKRLDEYISQLIKLTFIREINENENAAAGKEREFEIRRIIKSRISPTFLEEFKKRLLEQNEKNGVSEK